MAMMMTPALEWPYLWLGLLGGATVVVLGWLGWAALDEQRERGGRVGEIAEIVARRFSKAA